MKKNKLIRIGHTADVHLAYKQYGLTEREVDFRRAFAWVCSRAKILELDALIIAGDLFEMTRPSGDIVKFALEQIYELKEAGIAVMGIDGNHDLAENNWLHICGIFDVSSRFGRISNGEAVDSKDYYHCTIRGFNFTRGNSIREKLMEWASRERADILVLHQGLTEFSPIDKASEISAAEISAIVSGCGVKYVALGHFHSAAQKKIGDIIFRYSGSTEMNDISEDSEKSLTVLTIHPDGKVDIEIDPIPTRQIIKITIDNLQQLDEFCDIEKAPPDNDPLFSIYYNKNLIDVTSRLEDVLSKLDCIYRLIPTEVIETANDIKLVKSEAVSNLIELIRTKSTEWVGREISEDEYQLITQFLGNPDNSEVITNNYLQDKGLALTVKD